jgi:hypothetical protein
MKACSSARTGRNAFPGAPPKASRPPIELVRKTSPIPTPNPQVNRHVQSQDQQFDQIRSTDVREMVLSSSFVGAKRFDVGLEIRVRVLDRVDDLFERGQVGGGDRQYDGDSFSTAASTSPA